MVDNLISFFTNIIGEGQKLLPFITIGAILIGGYIQASGGAEGLQKAKKWYVGGSVGLIIGLGAKAIVDLIQANITF